MNKRLWIGSLALVTTLFPVLVAHAQETSPGDACSTPGRFTRSGGPEVVGAGYFLVCDGANWQRIIEYDDAANIGVKQAAPKAPLHVGGEAIIGVTTGLSCDANREGGIRYNTTSDCLELCDGSSWSCISVAACGDATPSAFDFTDLVNQSTSTLVTSNILQITGISCTVNVAVSGEGSPQLQTCSDPGCSTVLLDWTTTGTIDNNSYIRLRLTTSATGGDTYSATLSVGTTADVWNATPTGNCAGSPAAGTVCADGTVYAGMSPDGNVKMYVTRCDAGQTWNGSSCTGTRLSLPWNDGGDGWVYTGYSGSVSGEANTTAIVLIDANATISGHQNHAAASYCNDLSQDGHTDWYLPSSQETTIMYNSKDNIGNFLTSAYWTSRDFNTSAAYELNFTNGSLGTSFQNKRNSKNIRCARK